MFRNLSTLLSICIVIYYGPLHAEETEPSERLTIEITAPLIETKWMDSPTGVTLIRQEDIGNGRSALQPTDTLNLAPGVLVQNRNNFAQNPRVSIRGFGARAPFGIRGVRVRLDGIPLTTVDGQAQIDAIDPSSIKSIEVLRGANAVLHGNGSGGLLDYRTVSPFHTPAIKFETQQGGFNLQRYHAAFSQQHNDDTSGFAYRAAVTDLQQRGYREQSEVKRRNAGLWFAHKNAQRDTFIILNHLDNPKAEDPGALTLQEMQSDRSAAAPLARRMHTGQEVTQTILSAGITQQLGEEHQQFKIQGWTTSREFQQQLPFPGDSLIQFDRTIIGTSLSYQRPINELILHTQLHLEAQQDDRQRFCRNTSLQPFLCKTGITTDLALDQIESADNFGLGIQLAGPVFDEQGRWIVGIRNDRLRMRIDDNLQAGGFDNSGKRNYNETHYSLGYSHRLNNYWNAFSQYATSFEAPTFTEFANPTGNGFRPGLKPQNSRSFEIGIRGQNNQLQLEASLFKVRVEDEIIVDNNSGAPPTDERTFYRNANQTKRHGLELGGRWWPTTLPNLQLAGAITFMDARFDDNNNNKLPGLPDTTAYVGIDYHFNHGYFAGLTTQYIGDRYANDANTVKAASQTVSDLRIGREITKNKFNAKLVFGIENLFNEEHLDNLRINARNGRYYEPGAERRVYASIVIDW